MANKITTGHVVAGLLGAGVSAALASRPTAARISDSNNKVKQMEARYDLKKAQLQTAAATTNDRNEEIRHLNELIATYESQVKELTSLADALANQEMQMQADFGKQMQSWQTESSDLKTQLSQKTQSVENLSQTNAQYQQELSATKDKITLLESKVSTLNQVSNELNEINTHHEAGHHPEETYGMSKWYVDHMTGRGAHEIMNGKKVVTIDSDKFEVPVGITKSYGWKSRYRVTSSSAYTQAAILADVPNWKNHGHPEFTGDWVRRTGGYGKFYRPRSWDDWR